jgi:hypothetical protein
MRKVFVACVACVLLAACGASKPASPLILGDEAGAAVPGARPLNPRQAEKLRASIVSAGVPCSSIRGTYLRDVNVELQMEAWDVRCADRNYAVEILAEGPPRVHPCYMEPIDNAPCSVFRRYGSPQRAPEQLNPDLGKLLAPMTAPNGKND